MGFHALCHAGKHHSFVPNCCLTQTVVTTGIFGSGKRSEYVKLTLSVAKNESLIEKDFKMKTFIVYDLDSKMPVAVGEQLNAETARRCASVATGIFHANLFAEEIDFQKITYITAVRCRHSRTDFP